MTSEAAPERLISYTDAIREATEQAMFADPDIVLMGMGVDDHKAIHGSTRGLSQKFPTRVWDTPLSEDGMQGVANGLAMAGMRPIHVYTRFDFALLAANQIINLAAKSRYMYGGRITCPVVIRVAIGRSWGQGAQHSQGLHGLFAAIPGLRVVAPSSPANAKGLLLEALVSPDPVLYVEHRLLYPVKGHVEEKLYRTPFGQAQLTVVKALGISARRDSRGFVTIVALSNMVPEALHAARVLASYGVEVELIDPVSVSPLDRPAIIASVERTGKILVVDAAWAEFGTAAEILASVLEVPKRYRDAPMAARLGFAQASCPTAKNLENLFYPGAEQIATKAWELISPAPVPWGTFPKVLEEAFRGPF